MYSLFRSILNLDNKPGHNVKFNTFEDANDTHAILHLDYYVRTDSATCFAAFSTLATKFTPLFLQFYFNRAS